MKRYLLAGKYGLIIMLICSLTFVLNHFFALNLNQWGIVPRSPSHLLGILVSPFLHGSLEHLLSNFLPLVIFAMLIGMQGAKRFLSLFFFFIVTTGLAVWLFARGNTVHIGMSGVIYALWGYLLVYGFVRKKMIPLTVSLVTLIFYGGLIFGVFPTHIRISFESHLMGALIGAITGYCLAKRR